MKILVIQQKMIGDVLTSSIICDNLKRSRPNSIVHYMINENTEPVVKNHPSIDKLVLFKKEYRSNKFQLYKFLQLIRKEKYDVVIDAYGKLESNLTSFFSGAKTKIAWEKSYTKWIYNKTYDSSQRQESNNLAVKDRLLLVESFIDNEKIIVKPKIYLTDAEKKEAESFLKQFNLSLDDKIIMISVLGSSKNKTYPATYSAQLLDQIVKKTGAYLLFNYIPSQFDQAKEVYDHCDLQTQNHIKLDAFTPSLRSFLAVLSHCNALIGNEGGAVNMAKALNVPTFSIFSPWINKEAWHLFADENNQAIHLKDVKPDLYQNLARKQQKENALILYRAFEPALITEKLISFLTHIYPSNKHEA